MSYKSSRWCIIPPDLSSSSSSSSSCVTSQKANDTLLGRDGFLWGEELPRIAPGIPPDITEVRGCDPIPPHGEVVPWAVEVVVGISNFITRAAFGLSCDDEGERWWREVVVMVMSVVIVSSSVGIP